MKTTVSHLESSLNRLSVFSRKHLQQLSAFKLPDVCTTGIHRYRSENMEETLLQTQYSAHYVSFACTETSGVAQCR